MKFVKKLILSLCYEAGEMRGKERIQPSLPPKGPPRFLFPKAELVLSFRLDIVPRLFSIRIEINLISSSLPSIGKSKKEYSSPRNLQRALPFFSLQGVR
ncbi:hypothetical protein AVEN_185158-1 [Araneus ventricosus]|uniref:Uncharacterized protein n=1 Tax=Araneus ventricosus TaxID=182803 RepID=A0A4Y2KC90_ARAVE|nr:hypothetical protein AVEN_16308-1 [Araneus ventricosus]GBM99355.1 hypothetical protein AVEN_42458-1 [Araneus ventricosus]GBM99411.1 hypothetical protein AVEN_90753-1 [Araneus ventricosus]GBM99492.1 hypothetical protein AVEN_185158-1 [Araneus ventricosus]